FGWMLLAVGGITHLVLPRVLFDTYMADQRLPIALAFMIIACAHLDLRDEFVRRGFATVLVLLLAVRAFEVQGVWRELSRGTASFRDSVRHIERGSKVLVAYADPDNGDHARELWPTHAAFRRQQVRPLPHRRGAAGARKQTFELTSRLWTARARGRHALERRRNNVDLACLALPSLGRGAIEPQASLARLRLKVGGWR